jgi:hypothetical protein
VWSKYDVLVVTSSKPDAPQRHDLDQSGRKDGRKARFLDDPRRQKKAGDANEDEAFQQHDPVAPADFNNATLR